MYRIYIRKERSGWIDWIGMKMARRREMSEQGEIGETKRQMDVSDLASRRRESRRSRSSSRDEQREGAGEGLTEAEGRG